ncbi:MAG: type II toxin-antitoxin system Phd/YefM family antitoxin [Acidobacteriota bacterium]|nr:type II toxin-antitoxin system Phd/YefM family antitoxin [Acidobacteriota bacterium]
MAQETMVEKSIDDFQKQAGPLLDELNASKQSIVITQDEKPRAVIQDIHAYEETQRTLDILKIIARGEADVRDGKLIPQEKVFKEIEAQYFPDGLAD